MLKDPDQFFLIKSTLDNRVLFVLYCVCWRFSGRNDIIFENFLCKMGVITLSKELLILRDAKSVSNFELGFSIFSKWTRGRNSWPSLVSSVSSSFFRKSALWRIETFCESTWIHNLHVPVNYLFQGSYYTFSKCRRTLTQCRKNLSTFNFAGFFKLPTNFCFFVDTSFLGSKLFCNHIQKRTNGFFGMFCFHSFCIQGSTNQVLMN